MAMTPKERRNNGFYHWPDPKICPICKKKFYPAPLHAWKIGFESESEFVCSYHCMRAWEKDRSLWSTRQERWKNKKNE